ncbi:protein IN CHLOROPLAST ATPASE BIOGENESIS, chloroplastic-like [Pyrus communis]|uniref:protein IN CHLOROPLAST ATPASE BIOGENESIS, chloroplastic-like n=1 Tax=Pyrus communis TaxID=23211 RepID=UPI0035C11882
MKVCGGLVCGGSRATALPTVLLRHGRARPRCSYSSVTHDHVSFIKEVASTQPPQHLSQLLRMLKTRGESIVSPGAKEGLIPLAIPLARNSSGAVTALLRWPTAPAGMDMPVVEVRKHGVWLLAKNVDQFIHRILAEEDAKNSEERNEELFQASADVGEKLYTKGDFAKSQISKLDFYLLRKVGLFPDVLERKVKWHFEEGDYVSALVTGEFYTKKEHFPGFARPYVFNAEVLLKVGRTAEAKDAARGALKSPWWTLGCSYQEVADIAQWEDEQIEYIKEKVTEEGRQADIKKGKAPAQVALDEAAFLLDLASIDGTWDDYVEQVADRYKEAGLQDIAGFVLYRD